MKKWITFWILMFSLCLAIIVTLIGFNLHATTPTYRVEEVSQMVLKGPCGGALCAPSYTLIPENSKDRVIITKIINWLNAAKVIGESKGEFVSFGGMPRMLEIDFKTGTGIIVESSADVVSKKIKNGVEIHTVDAPGQITISQPKKKPMRLLSPEMKAWINSNWKQDLTQ